MIDVGEVSRVVEAWATDKVHRYGPERGYDEPIVGG